MNRAPKRNRGASRCHEVDVATRAHELVVVGKAALGGGRHGRVHAAALGVVGLRGVDLGVGRLLVAALGFPIAELVLVSREQVNWIFATLDCSAFFVMNLAEVSILWLGGNRVGAHAMQIASISAMAAMSGSTSVRRTRRSRI